MIRCPSCGATHPRGTLFCDECGSRLTAEAAGAAKPPAPSPAGGAPSVVRVALYSRDQTKQFDCALSGELLIGRADAGAGVSPDIDLTKVRGATQGASRRHARLIRAGAVVQLEDLDSTNGTFVRGVRLPARQPQEIRSGDDLQFGGVVLIVRIGEP